MVKSKNVTTKRLAADISSPNGIFRKIATIFMQLQGKVKLVSHRSYGFRNDDRYIEAIYHNCGHLPLPED